MTGLMMVISLDSSPNVKCQSELLTTSIQWAFANLNSPCRSVARRSSSKDHKIQDSQEQELLRGTVGDGIEMIYDKRNVTIIICENSKI